MSAPLFFADAGAFRLWLASHAAASSQLLVGYDKVAAGRQSMSWSDSVDEALCFGWIDGRRQRIDEHAYAIRFTPRRPASIWSTVNIENIARLLAAGRMTPAGERAFALRSPARSGVYAHEQAQPVRLSAADLASFERSPAAWAYFQATPPAYRRRQLHWVAGAKKSVTRTTRLAKLVEACNAGKRLP